LKLCPGPYAPLYFNGIDLSFRRSSRSSTAWRICWQRELLSAYSRIIGQIQREKIPRAKGGEAMVKFLLWCILLVLCWPLALVALVLFPLVWLLLLPFRVAGIAVGGVLNLVGAIFTLPARIIRAI
jgi:hypothetical protein